MIYLDYNATSPLSVPAKKAMIEAMDICGNPSSVHIEGRRAKALLDHARSNVANLVGGRARDVVFTGGGTESNNTVLRQNWIKKVIISAVEHDCIFAATAQMDYPVTICPVDTNGIIDLAYLEAELKLGTDGLLVSVMAANNETGVLQPLDKIGQLVASYGGRFHTDAAQMAGRLCLDLPSINADYITLAAHKFGGPKGVGAIILAPTTPLDAFIVGGGQELGRRSGTENISGIAGMGAAAENKMQQIKNGLHKSRIETLRNQLEKRLKAIDSHIFIASEGAERLPNTSCVAMKNVTGSTQVMHMDLAGICVSSGSACSSGKVKISHVLSAMGHKTLADQTIRISLGDETSADDIDRFITAWKDLFSRLQPAP